MTQLPPFLPALFEAFGNQSADFRKTKSAHPALALLTYSNDAEVLTDTCWALSHLSLMRYHTFLGWPHYLGASDIKPLYDLHVCPDPWIITAFLEGFENILKVGLEKIYHLRSHDNNEIYEMAVKIVETYWLEDKDEQLTQGDAFQSRFRCASTVEQIAVCRARRYFWQSITTRNTHSQSFPDGNSRLKSRIDIQQPVGAKSLTVCHIIASLSVDAMIKKLASDSSPDARRPNIHHEIDPLHMRSTENIWILFHLLSNGHSDAS
ncbi:hypothetical protein Vadar_005347 [Vaccinium darrowii]|uniref:Uncharacterized protein n=1 Tax=Vaccinium darrowii TaxID=229202 RepID=A0ACB7YBT0_9ERIC|nr:hypothetical protein Vadar_005347 [Vaccinium darrowii]